MTQDEWRVLLNDPDAEDYWLLRTAYADWWEERGDPQRARCWRLLVARGWKPCDCRTLAEELHRQNLHPLLSSQQRLNLHLHNNWKWFTEWHQWDRSYIWDTMRRAGKTSAHNVLPQRIFEGMKSAETLVEAEEKLIDRLLDMVDVKINIEKLTNELDY